MGGALAPVAAATSSHQGLPVGCLWFTNDLSWAWQGRKGDHVWEKRCSRLDLLGCDPGPSYAARGFNTREAELASRSLLLRDDARAASASSQVLCRIVGAPPLCAPARVFPGRTLLEGEGRVGSRASPQVQSTPLFSWRWPAGVPVPVPPDAWICGLLHPRGNLNPARAIPASQPADCHGLPSPPLRPPGPAALQLPLRGPTATARGA